MDKYIVGATIALIGVIISNIVTYRNQKKVLEDNKIEREERRKLNKDINALQANQAQHLTEIENELDNISYLFKTNYAKRRDVLSEFYSKISGVRLLLESYVVPLFDDSEIRNIDTIIKASRKFEELYIYFESNKIYINDSDYYIRELSEVMALINRMKNIARTEDKDSIKCQRKNIKDGINPVIKRVEDRIRKDLEMDK